MINYETLSRQPGPFLALTGLTTTEFRDLLPAFELAYDRALPSARTATGQPRQRWPGAGRHGALATLADKLLFVLVYLKTYPLQVVLGKLFGLSITRANYWLHRLLPLLRGALDNLGVLPERDGSQLPAQTAESAAAPLIIIDATERRRQRPKKAEKQALHYSGKKKAHTDKNVLIVCAADCRVLFLSGTYAGKAHEKRIADEARLRYPPGAILYKDAGFQGYEPPVRKTCQAKKKAAEGRASRTGETRQWQTRADPSPRGARACRCEAQPHCPRRVPEQEARAVRPLHGDCLWST
jgi:DDE superfamily endonuclease/Helix-turn-helix of DDE superfamily endonuclease